MKIIYLTGVFSLLFFLSNAQWIQTGGPYGGYLNNIAKVGTEIWAASESGIYVSKDEGLTWKKSSFLNNYICTGLASFNDTIVIVYQSDNTYSITSFDGGLTWIYPAIITIGQSASGTPIRIQNTLLCSNNVSYDWGYSWYPFVPRPDADIRYSSYSSKDMIINIYHYYSGYKSLFISRDGLQTWQFLDSLKIYNHVLANESSILVLAFPFNIYGAYKILRSPDFGITWNTVLQADSGEYFNSMTQDGITTYVTTNANNVTSYYKSTDDGLTWTPLPSLPPKLYNKSVTLSNGDILAITKQDITRFASAVDTSYSTNTGLNCNRITMLKSNASKLFASTLIELYTSTDGQTWQGTGIKPGESEDIVFMGDTVIAVGRGFMVRSFDNGATWDSVKPIDPYFANQDYYTIDKIGSRIFVSWDRIYYSDNYGVTFDTLPLLTNLYDRVGAIRVQDNDLFCVSNSGTIYKFDFGLSTWSALTSFSPVGAHSENVLYLVDSVLVMAGKPTLLLSSDHGQSWSTSTLTGIPTIPRSIISNNGIWIGEGSSYGVYISYDKGNNWQPLEIGTVLFSARGGLTVYKNILFAGSHYTGVWRRSGAFTTTSGRVFNDLNNNNVSDSGEPGFANNLVMLQPANIAVSTDMSGNYSLLTDIKGDSLKPVMPVFFATSNPGHYITNGTAQNRDFAIQIPSSVRDLTTDITNANVFRPGFSTNLVVKVLNKGSLSQLPQVEVALDNNLHFVSATPAPNNIAGNTLQWSLAQIDLLQTQTITITVKTDVGAALNTNITCNAFVTPIVGDTLVQDNYAVLKEPVVGSFDPNDKNCKQGHIISPEQVIRGEEMIFTVRFQNTGNYQADFINIADTLSEYFDISTFRVISSSHKMEYTMKANAVNFNFSDIFLPPSSQDEPGSHGFVKYGLRCKKTMVLGNAVTNTAYIYFDYNPAIITNTTATLVAIPLSINEAGNTTGRNDVLVKVYPNPTRDVLNVDLSEIKVQGLSISMYDVNGRLIRTEKPNDTISAINMQHFANGIYLGRISDASGNSLGAFRFVLNK